MTERPPKPPAHKSFLDEFPHVVALAVTTLGMPTAVAAYTWVNDILEDDELS